MDPVKAVEMVDKNTFCVVTILGSWGDNDSNIKAL